MTVRVRNTESGDYHDLAYDIQDQPLPQAWARALHLDYLSDPNIVMAKSFCLHGWGDSNTKTKAWLCSELNWHIARVNDYFRNHDVDYSVRYAV